MSIFHSADDIQHFRPLSLSLVLSLSLSFALFLSHILIHLLTHTHTRAHWISVAHIQTYPRTCSHAHTLYIYFTPTLSSWNTHPYSLLHAHTHIESLSHTTLSSTLPYSPSHTNTNTLSLSRSGSPSQFLPLFMLYPLILFPIIFLFFLCLFQYTYLAGKKPILDYLIQCEEKIIASPAGPLGKKENSCSSKISISIRLQLFGAVVVTQEVNFLGFECEEPGFSPNGADYVLSPFCNAPTPLSVLPRRGTTDDNFGPQPVAWFLFL